MALTVRAIHTFVAEHGDELDFHAGDDIVVLEKDEAFGDGWWRVSTTLHPSLRSPAHHPQGRNTKGEEGLFPATYIAEATQPAVDQDLDAKDAASDVNAVNGDEPAPPAAIATPGDGALLGKGDDPTPGGWPADNLAVPAISLPDQSPKGTTTVDAQGGILESAMAATGVGAAAANVGNVMHRTIGDIQDAIESYARPESDDEHEQEELGIGQDARAKLVEQARLANEKRERDETGFVYSDESEDEEEDIGKSLPLVTKSRTSIGTDSQAINGFHDNVKEEMAPAESKPIETERETEPALIPAPVVASSTAAATAAAAATDAPSTPSLEPKPELTPLVPSSSEQREPSVGTLQPAFIPATPPLVQTPPAVAPPAVAPPAAAATTPTPSAQAPSSASNRSPSIPPKPVTTWTVDDVASWAQAKGFDEGICDKFRGKFLFFFRYYANTMAEHEISGDVLLELDANLLKELDIIAFGKRMRIAAAISELRRPSSMISSSSQQFSPSGLPTHMSPGVSLRGMSAPPSSSSYGMGMAQPTFPSTPPLSTPPMPSHSEEPEPGAYSAWAHHPKKHGAPVMEAINEKPHPQPDAQTQPETQTQPASMTDRSSQPPPSNTAPSSIRPASTTTAASMPVSPITPGSTVTKRESVGSLGRAGGGGHKRGKQSVDSSKDRLSFFGRNRKPAPLGAVAGAGAAGTATATGTGAGGEQQQARSTSSRLGFGKVHQMQPASPQNKYISGPTAIAGAGAGGAAGGLAAAAGGGALKQIGTPDYAGYLKKKGERYGGWKTRYVVLKGSTLYILKTDNADSLKDRIDLHAHRIMVDDNTNPGSYGFRLAPSAGHGGNATIATTTATGGTKSHSFSASEQTVVRGWMKALLKATIARDYTKPITSSCNIPTIPLAEAQALAPRPPSPTTREAMQRATRRENPNQLTPHDANILVCILFASLS